MRGASRLKTHTASTQIATNSAAGTSSQTAPAGEPAGPGAVGSITHLRASSKIGASGLSSDQSRSVARTVSTG